MEYIVPKKAWGSMYIWKIHEYSRTDCESKRDLKIRLQNGIHVIHRWKLSTFLYGEVINNSKIGYLIVAKKGQMIAKEWTEHIHQAWITYRF